MKHSNSFTQVSSQRSFCSGEENAHYLDSEVSVSLDGIWSERATNTPSYSKR